MYSCWGHWLFAHRLSTLLYKIWVQWRRGLNDDRPNGCHWELDEAVIILVCLFQVLRDRPQSQGLSRLEARIQRDRRDRVAHLLPANDPSGCNIYALFRVGATTPDLRYFLGLLFLLDVYREETNFVVKSRCKCTLYFYSHLTVRLVLSL